MLDLDNLLVDYFSSLIALSVNKGRAKHRIFDNGDFIKCEIQLENDENS